MSDLHPHIAKMNSDFNEENMVGIVCNMKSSYAYLKCVYKDCKFEHWFSYTKGSKSCENL